MIRKGNDIKKGTKKEIIAKSTSPANILPKRRKEKEITLDISDIISNIPIKKVTGLLKFINFLT